MSDMPQLVVLSETFNCVQNLIIFVKRLSKSILESSWTFRIARQAEAYRTFGWRFSLSLAKTTRDNRKAQRTRPPIPCA